MLRTIANGTPLTTDGQPNIVVAPSEEIQTHTADNAQSLSSAAGLRRNARLSLSDA